MKQMISLIFSLLFLPLLGYGQIDNEALGARARGLGNAAVTLRETWAIFNNVAGLATLEDASLGFTYDNRFGVAEFQTFGIAGVLPVAWGVGGLSVSRFGDELYSETRIGLGFARELDKVSLGLKVNYLQVNLQDLGSAGAVVLEFGGLVQISPELHLGAHIYNLNQAQMTTDFDDAERIPTVLKAGLSFRPIETLRLNVETEKDIDYEASFKAGVEYEIIPKLSLRTGIQTKPFANHFGLGFRPRRLDIQYALSSHQVLGLSHHLSLAWQFTQKNTSK